MNRVKNFLLKRVFHYVTTDSVLRIQKGRFFIGDKLVPESEAKQLIAEARDIEKMLLWGIINNNLLYSIHKEMYEKYTKHDDMIAGKAMIYTAESYKDLIRKVSLTKLDYKEPK